MRCGHFSGATLVAALVACSPADVPDDTGRAWEVLQLPSSAEIWSIQFLDARRGYLTGGGIFVEGGLIGRTLDGGASWEIASGLVAKPAGATSMAFYDLFFLDAERAFLVGHAGILMRSSSGWRGFELERRGAIYAHLRDLHFVDDEVGWAIGDNGLLGTFDGGESWRWLALEGSDRSRVSARALHFVDRRRGYLAGRNGKLQRTFDGGLHWWEPEAKPETEERPHLFGIHFAGPRHGWAVGERGTIWNTTDGGRSWAAQESGVRDFLMDVHFIDRERGWAVGHDRQLRRAVVLGTENGGELWRIEVTLPDEELYAVDAVPTGEAWAVGKHVGRGRQRLLRRVPDAAVAR